MYFVRDVRRQKTVHAINLVTLWWLALMEAIGIGMNVGCCRRVVDTVYTIILI